MTPYIFISDIHLASNLCQAKQLIEFLKQCDLMYPDYRLVIVGDLINDPKHMSKKMKKSHLKILNILRDLKERALYVKGNHDELPLPVLRALFGIDFKSKEVITISDESLSKDIIIAAIHGDIWDVYIYKYRLLATIGTTIFDFFQNIASEATFSFIRNIKKVSREFLRNKIAVKNAALEWAKNHNYDIVICGHTHAAELTLDTDTGIIYGNCGTWQTDIPTALILSQGTLKLIQFTNDEIQTQMELNGIFFKP